MSALAAAWAFVRPVIFDPRTLVAVAFVALITYFVLDQRDDAARGERERIERQDDAAVDRALDAVQRSRDCRANGGVWDQTEQRCRS